ncbi:hypothetical protein GCM10027217_19210 [Pseudomaricurvus hydrocarbonicus]
MGAMQKRRFTAGGRVVEVVSNSVVKFVVNCSAAESGGQARISRVEKGVIIAFSVTIREVV